MRKHNLLLSLLALLFAVFMTACESSSSSSAKAPISGGGDQGGIVAPSLTITYEQSGDNYRTYNFTATLSNGNSSDYTYLWNFGDGNPTNGELTISHTFNADKIYNVTLVATPNSDAVPNIAAATATVSVSKSGAIVGQDLRYSAIDGVTYEFTALASTTNGSKLTYTWDFGDGNVMDNTSSNSIEHVYTKYNKTFTVQVTVYSDNGDSLAFQEIQVATLSIHPVISVTNDPDNGALKNFEVLVIDDNGNIVHGGNNSDENRLDNVSYAWDFGDPNATNGADTNNTTSNTTSYTYVAGTDTSKERTVTVSISSDSLDEAISATATANIDLTYALTTVEAVFGSTDGMLLYASAIGNGGTSYANKTPGVKFKFTFPDGGSQTVEAGQHNEDGFTSQKSVSHTFSKYYNPYTVLVQALDSSDNILAEKTIYVGSLSFQYTLSGPESGGDYFTKTFRVNSGDWYLVDAQYTWTITGTGIQNGIVSTSSSPTLTHTFSGPGAYNVSVVVSSEKAQGVYSISQPKAISFSIDASVTLNSLTCNNDGADTNFLQYTCVASAQTTGGNLVYEWYVNDELQANQTGSSFTHAFSMYNQSNNITVKAGVEGSSDAKKELTLPVNTPNVDVSIAGPDVTTEQQQNTYTATTSVTHNGSTKNITLADVSYTWKNQGNVESGANTNTLQKTFMPGSGEWGNGTTLRRTITVDVTASNLKGTISASKTTTVNKRDATIADLNTPVLSCTPIDNNGINQVRQNCKITLSTSSDVNVDYTKFNGKITYNGTTKPVTFNSNGVSVTATFDFAWPSNGEITTGQNPSTTYTVTGYVYKDNENTKLEASSAAVNVSLANIDYVLFPLPTQQSGKGGSGYRLGTWSCGYNEVYGQSTDTSKLNCGSANSASGGSTLKLGNFVDGSGNLKAGLKLTWGMRVHNSNGTTKNDVTILTKTGGSAISDSDTSFDITQKVADIGGYTGRVFGNAHMFYLKISSDDQNILAQPVTVWYDGTNKTNNGNRLRVLGPVATNGGNLCVVGFKQYGDQYSGKTAKMVYKDGYFSTNIFGGVDPVKNNRPKLKIVGYPKTTWGELSSIEYTDTGLTSKISGSWLYFEKTNRTESGYIFAPENGNGPSFTGSITGGRATMTPYLRDMLKGGTGYYEGNYYEGIGCNIQN